MLSNAYFLAKFRFDTAENEPAQNLQHFAKFANYADPTPSGAAAAQGAGPKLRSPATGQPALIAAELSTTRRSHVAAQRDHFSRSSGNFNTVTFQILSGKTARFGILSGMHESMQDVCIRAGISHPFRERLGSHHAAKQR